MILDRAARHAKTSHPRPPRRIKVSGRTLVEPLQLAKARAEEGVVKALRPRGSYAMRLTVDLFGSPEPVESLRLPTLESTKRRITITATAPSR